MFSKKRKKKIGPILAHVEKYAELSCDIHLAWNLQNKQVVDKILFKHYCISHFCFLFLGSAGRAEPFKYADYHGGSHLAWNLQNQWVFDNLLFDIFRFV